MATLRLILSFIFRPNVNINAASASEMFKSVSPALILIDFGISLDMRLLPPGAEFKMAFENKDNRTPEMIEGKNWSYQVYYNFVTNTLLSCYQF